MRPRRVTSDLGTDADATTSIFATVADTPWTANQRGFSPPVIHELAEQLAGSAYQSVQAGWSDLLHSPTYQPPTASSWPEAALQAVQSDWINAELAFAAANCLPVQGGHVDISAPAPLTLTTPGIQNDVDRRLRLQLLEASVRRYSGGMEACPVRDPRAKG